MDSDWQHGKTLEESNEYMLTNEILYDITFLAGENKTPVKAHKYMLVSRSPVFYAMFCGQLAESRDAVEVPDIEADILKDLFRYLYTGKCIITDDNVIHLVYAAKKYSIPGLEQECGSYLGDRISGETAFDILQQVHAFDYQEIVEKCMEYILQNASEVLKSEGFQSITRELVKYIIGQDDLAVRNEVEVYEACKRWAESQCRKSNRELTPENIREVLGDVINLIRFPLMTAEAFTDHVSDDRILDDRSIIEVYKYLSIGREPDQFNTRNRKSMVEASKIVNRFTGKIRAHHWIHCHKEDAVCLSASTDFYLIGLTLFLPCSEGKVEGELKVMKDETVLIASQITLQYNGNFYEDVILEKPVLLRRNTNYTLSQTVNGVRTFAGEAMNITVESEGIAFQFTDSNRSTNGTKARFGQFARLLIIPFSNLHAFPKS